MRIADFFHRTATGPRRRRALLTPVGLLVFGSSLFLVISGGLVTDRTLGLAELPWDSRSCCQARRALFLESLSWRPGRSSAAGASSASGRRRERPFPLIPLKSWSRLVRTPTCVTRW
jgi:hypothetical protein